MGSHAGLAQIGQLAAGQVAESRSDRTDGEAERRIPSVGQHVEVEQVLEYAYDGEPQRGADEQAYRGGLHDALECGGAIGGYVLYIIHFYVLLRCEVRASSGGHPHPN